MDELNTKTSANYFEEMVSSFQTLGELDIERAKITIAEQIFQAMERELVSKAELARRLNKSRPYVTQILQGGANFTIESLVRIAFVLNCNLNLKIEARATPTWNPVEKPFEKCLSAVIDINAYRQVITDKARQVITDKASSTEIETCSSVPAALAMAA